MTSLIEDVSRPAPGPRPGPGPRPAVPARARKYRPDIQGLRTVAVLLVALYHAHVPFLSGGFVGVDVFFVISGFLITGHLYQEAMERGKVDLLGFYARRFRRLLPAVVLVVGLTALAARFVLTYDQLKSLVSDIYFASFYGINYHFAAEGVQYQNAASPPPLLQHFWSLAVEEQFYAVWPLIVLGVAVLAARRFRRYALLLIVGAVTTATLWYSIHISATNHAVAYFSLQTRAWELGAGAVVALSAPFWVRLPAWAARIVSWAGLMAIGVSAVVYNATTVYPGIAATVPVLGCAVLLGAGMLRNTGTPETVFLERQAMQLGGRYSYAWYLWHWPMLLLLAAWVGHPLTVWENVEIVALALWFAVLTYFLENSAQRRQWTLRRWSRYGVFLSCCVALIGLIANAILPSLATTGVARQTTALVSANPAVVQQALQRSLPITALPRNLTPTLANAVQDYPTPWTSTAGVSHNVGHQCQSDLPATVPTPCVFGDLTSTHTAVLIGDSHAYQWLSPLVTQALRNHWKLVVMTKGACSVADLRYWESDLNREYRECDAYRPRLRSIVAQLKPELVIASQANAVPWTSVTDKKWADATATALTRLAPSAAITYIGDTPTTTNNPLTCLQRNLGDARKCIVPAKQAFGLFYQRYFQMKKTLSAANVRYLDTLPFFCTATSCPAVVDNMVVHRDNGHITDTYAAWLTPMFDNVFPKERAK